MRISEITGGTATNDGHGGITQSSGGGILSFGTVDLENVAVIGNKSQNNTSGVGTGGGIIATGPLTINQSLISGNNAIGGTAGGGALLSSGTLTITDSVIQNNAATGTLRFDRLPQPAALTLSAVASTQTQRPPW